MRSETFTHGIRFVPDRPNGVGVLTIAGSSGRIDTDRAKLFALYGAVAESIRWFGGEGQNPGPWEIPIETFQARLAALGEHCDRLIVSGTSFGAEAALLTSAVTPLVDVAIGFTPSDVVWAGVRPDGAQTSHWTLGGEPVPFVPFADDWQPEADPPTFAPLYELSRKVNPDAAQAASIQVERIPEVVLIAGGDDRVWPGQDHARRIETRRTTAGLPTTVITDADAGHRTVLPGEPVVAAGQRMARGGTVDADRRLGQAAWQVIEPMLRGE